MDAYSRKVIRLYNINANKLKTQQSSYVENPLLPEYPPPLVSNPTTAGAYGTPSDCAALIACFEGIYAVPRGR